MCPYVLYRCCWSTAAAANPHAPSPHLIHSRVLCAHMHCPAFSGRSVRPFELCALVCLSFISSHWRILSSVLISPQPVPHLNSSSACLVSSSFTSVNLGTHLLCQAPSRLRDVIFSGLNRLLFSKKISRRHIQLCVYWLSEPTFISDRLRARSFFTETHLPYFHRLQI